MKTKLSCPVVVAALISLISACGEGARREIVPVGPYLGLEPPGSVPVVFAPGLISTGVNESGITLSPDGREILFSVQSSGLSVILRKWEGEEGWRGPEVPIFSGRYRDWEPIFSPDGTRLYFVSNRPIPGWDPQVLEGNLWVAKKTPEGWDPAEPVPGAVNTPSSHEGFPSVTEDGTLFFFRHLDDPDRLSEIFQAVHTDEGYSEPRPLGPEVNSPQNDWDPFISFDGGFLIFSSLERPDSLGDSDLYVSFRREDGSWTCALNMGPDVNSPAREICPFVSRDGRFLFFKSYREDSKEVPEHPLTYDEVLERLEGPGNGNGEIYWVATGILRELRERAR